MTTCSSWSKRSRDCRIELRASRWLALSLVALGAAGIPAWALSDAPAWLAGLGAVVGVGAACRLARRECARTAVELHLAADGRVAVDGVFVEGFEVRWRGPLMALSWCDDRRAIHRLAFPDALDGAARRELRLWALGRRERAVPAAVAP